VASVLTPQSEDFPRWYQDVVAKGEMAENGPVRGTMVIRPYGWSLWERMQSEMDTRIKESGAQNAYFPLFIPLSYFQREAEHVEGFSPELAVVTHAGGEELAEPIVVRPTSETVIGEFMAKWIQSYRDLPLLLNQWSNVVRWELRPRLFLRSSEFLWQEGHTAHASYEDANAFATKIHLEVYNDFLEEVLAAPTHLGIKPASERFPGAINSMTAEAMMRDGKALQMGTSHELGQRFARMFGIEFQSESGSNEFAWQTSWGTSTRLIGAAIMAHGDDSGLRLAPRLAPVQVAVVLVKADQGADAVADGMASDLSGSGHRVEFDARVDVAYGRRVTDWELKGVPVRVEVGPRDLAHGVVTVVRRDTGDRAEVTLNEVAAHVSGALDSAQTGLLEQARAFMNERLPETAGIDEAIEAAKSGFARISAGLLRDGGEEKLAREAITVRCLISPDMGLPNGHDDPEAIAVVGRAY
jgi:prolyl-tRNA synthetase